MHPRADPECEKPAQLGGGLYGREKKDSSAVAETGVLSFDPSCSRQLLYRASKLSSSDGCAASRWSACRVCLWRMQARRKHTGGTSFFGKTGYTGGNTGT